MKILLINPPGDISASLGGFENIYKVMPPVNLGYLAGYLEKNNIIPRVLDGMLLPAKKAISLILAKVKEISPDVIGISCLTQTADISYLLSHEIRKISNAKIVFGNLHASYFAEDILRENVADIVAHGEGEETLLHLMKCLQNNNDLSSIEGISFRKDGEIIHNKKRNFIENLDNLPFPAWHLLEREKYKLFSFAEIKTPATLISASRGCPYNCSFCSLLIMGHKRRVRSIKNIVDEFEYMHNNFGYKQISFVDPIFPFTKKEGLNFAEELIKRNLHQRIIWTTETRVDLVDEELLKCLKMSGLKRIMYGFETGSDIILSDYKKQFTLQDAIDAVRITKKYGIEIIGFFILGAPTDTPESILKTIDFARGLNIDFAKFNILVPYPGTGLHKKLKQEGRIPEGQWQRYTSYPTKKVLPIYSPDGISKEELVDLQKLATKKFYLRLKIIFKFLFKTRTVSLRDILLGGISLIIPKR